MGAPSLGVRVECARDKGARSFESYRRCRLLERFCPKTPLNRLIRRSGTGFAMWTGTLASSPSAVTLTGNCRMGDSKIRQMKLDKEFNSSRERFGLRSRAIHLSLKAYAA